MESNILTRKQFYDLVWSHPLKELAEKYNVSTTFLRKLCDKHNIPLPIGGHWTKLKWNKPFEIIDFPNPENSEEEIKIQELKPIPAQKPIPKLKKEESPLIHFEGISLDKKLFEVPNKLRKPLPQISKLKEEMKKHEPNEGWFSSRGNMFDIKVSPNNLNRALRILNTLLQLFQFLGYEVVNRWKSELKYQDISVEFNMREPRTRSYEKSKYGGWEMIKFTPTGVLSITFGTFPKKEFRDTKIPLEKKIPKIIDYIMKRFKKEMLERERLNEFWRVRDEEERKIQEVKDRVEEEYHSFITLRNRAFLWRESQSIHAYISAKQGVSNLSDEDQEYHNWAKKKASWLNPLNQIQDNYLDDDHKIRFLKSINHVL